MAGARPQLKPHCRAVLRTGTVSQAAGSAYIEVGATKAMAAVYGPRPTDRREAFSEEGHLGVDVKLASFATRTRGRITQVQWRLMFIGMLTSGLRHQTVWIIELATQATAVPEAYCCNRPPMRGSG